MTSLNKFAKYCLDSIFLENNVMSKVYVSSQMTQIFVMFYETCKYVNEKHDYVCQMIMYVR